MTQRTKQKDDGLPNPYNENGSAPPSYAYPIFEKLTKRDGARVTQKIRSAYRIIEPGTEKEFISLDIEFQARGADGEVVYTSNAQKGNRPTRTNANSDPHSIDSSWISYDSKHLKRAQGQY
jgi:hypothetical protein